MWSNLNKGYGAAGSRQRASILIAAVWALVFLTFMGTALYGIFSSKAKILKFVQERAVSELAAYSACRYAQMQIKSDKTEYDTLAEFKGTLEKAQGLWGFSYETHDEQSRININKATAEVISRLPGSDIDLASHITSSTLRPFRLKEELLGVEGMDKEIYDGIKDLITVYGTGEVNINTASREVLKALGIDESLVDRIILFKGGSDGQPGTEDDGVFEDAATIVKTLENNGGLTLADKNKLTILFAQQLLGVASSSSFVDIKTTSLGKQIGRYGVILDVESIKEWRES